MRNEGEVGCRTGRYRNGGVQERRDARKEGCRKAGVQESMGARKEGLKSRDEGRKVGFENALLKRRQLNFSLDPCRFVSLDKCFVSRNTKHTKLDFVC